MYNLSHVRKKVRLNELDKLHILFAGAATVLVIGFFTYLNTIISFVAK